ncbi:uncharacterized protein B0H18DRAFT_496170 [Fomitopsis serialis]|uniref:uncharacterized protein n=1 Tax=Fomitopsis serialis TaxID=139415 RepID=UPI002007ECB7|nr:uncharacterized protein B0H18DRAFT_496170 [Neoantrodia serialis]KAH9935025.1 hypothetical protein B0H18DRAFT_496170 [Neoantrodia serialis]
MPSRAATRDSDSRHVNNLLHTLRRALSPRAKFAARETRASLLHSSYNNPTLPFDQIYAARAVQPEPPATRSSPPVRLGPEGVLEYAYPRGRVPGPRPPPSWSGLFDADVKGNDGDPQGDEECAWRSNALSLIYSHLPPSTSSDAVSVPRLTLLCLQYLVALYPGQDASEAFAEDVVPYLPVHLRRHLIRWAAIHDPLPTTQLFALADSGRHVDGELIVVGPRASLPRDVFKAKRPTSQHAPIVEVPIAREDATDALESWDSPSFDERTPQPMQNLILVSIALPVNTLLTFPPTLTRLALLALPAPAPIHRLPRICPLIEVLDLSFNNWLAQPHAGSKSVLERVEWDRWSHLKVLGLKETGVGEEIVRRVNKGRWVDVDIVGVVSLEVAMSNLHWVSETSKSCILT